MGSGISSTTATSTTKWTATEQQQMINIQHVWKQCFPPPITAWIDEESRMAKVKTAAETPEEATSTDVILSGKWGGDNEEFLAPDSLLRTVDGKRKAPKNRPFMDFESFKESCKFQHWRSHFETLSNDPILTVAAKTIVSHICMLQSKKQLHYHHTSFPGSSLLQKKREQMVPLTLFLHELKLWATYELRTLNPFEKKSATILDRRMKYVEAMQSEDIWAATSKTISRNIKKEAMHSLFLVLLDIKEQIMRCRDYCKRCFTNKGNIDKLQLLSDSLRQILLYEGVLVSSIFETEYRLSHPSTGLFSPLDLLNSPRAQHFIDYENIANVCLFNLFRKPLAQAALLADFESVGNVIDTISDWRLRDPFTENGAPRVESSGFGAGYLPTTYSSTADDITNYLRDIDPGASVPLTAETQVKNLKSYFKDGEDLKSAIHKFLQVLGVLFELIPVIVVINEFSQIGKHGGNYTIYESLGEEIKIVLGKAEEVARKLNNKERELIAAFSKCAASVERSMEEERIRTRKSPKPPIWVENLASVKHTTLLLTTDAFKTCYELAQEIRTDITNYDMSADRLNDKIKYVKALCNQLATTTAAAKLAEPKVMGVESSMQTPRGDSPSEVRAA